MPISRQELEEGRIDLTIPIVRILTGRPDLGFNAQEIQQLLVETDARNVPLVEVERALGILVQRNRVQTSELNEQRWYTLVQRRLGFRTER